MNRNLTLEQIRANMRNNLHYLMKKGSMSLSSLSAISGASKQILARWVSDIDYTEPSLKFILSVVKTLDVNIEDFLYTDMSDIENNITEYEPKPNNKDDALALGMFQALNSFDRDTVLRTLHCFVSSGTNKYDDFFANVAAEIGDTPVATARTARIKKEDN